MNASKLQKDYFSKKYGGTITFKWNACFNLKIFNWILERLLSYYRFLSFSVRISIVCYFDIHPYDSWISAWQCVTTSGAVIETSNNGVHTSMWEALTNINLCLIR
jgi:hypothetical protein